MKQYMVKKKYLGYDDKYLGRKCHIVRELGKAWNGVMHVMVQFEDGSKEAFPMDCLEPEDRKA